MRANLVNQRRQANIARMRTRVAEVHPCTDSLADSTLGLSCRDHLGSLVFYDLICVVRSIRCLVQLTSHPKGYCLTFDFLLIVQDSRLPIIYPCSFHPLMLTSPPRNSQRPAPPDCYLLTDPPLHCEFSSPDHLKSGQLPNWGRLLHHPLINHRDQKPCCTT